MIPLPEWIDAELWDEYVAQRKADRKAMSPRSARERLARLYDLRAAGHDPNEAIKEALNGHWLDFYVPRDKTIERRAASFEDVAARLRAEDANRQPPRPEDVAKVRAVVANLAGRMRA